MCKVEHVIAKAQVTFEMVEFSCDLGLQNIIFLKEDSLQVVNVVKANGPNWWLIYTTCSFNSAFLAN
jgi:hypothetical protein